MYWNWGYIKRAIKRRFKREEPEIRWDKVEDGKELDEVVVDRPDYFHLEYMDNDVVWIGLYLKDGRTIHINLVAAKEPWNGNLVIQGSAWTEPSDKPVKEKIREWKTK